MSTDISPTGRYVIRSFHKGQQMNDPQWGWDDLISASAHMGAIAADNSNAVGCEWIVWDRQEDREVSRVRSDQ